MNWEKVIAELDIRVALAMKRAENPRYADEARQAAALIAGILGGIARGLEEGIEK